MTVEQQLGRLQERGMLVPNEFEGLAILSRYGYYALAGYTYPYRLRNPDGSRSDRFREGVSLEMVEALLKFDDKLRIATFAAIQKIEPYLRALMGQALGEIDPEIHRKPQLLQIDEQGDFTRWTKKLAKTIASSREDYILHHVRNRDSEIPIWVIVNTLDWGSLLTLYSFSPHSVREKVASEFGLSVAQMRSWLKALNVVRNTCAHHGRLFNRYYSIQAKLPRNSTNSYLAGTREHPQSTFAMLTLIQYLLEHTRGGNLKLLPAVLRSFPTESELPISLIGAPSTWTQLPLWN